jgi:hypothetical protein
MKEEFNAGIIFKCEKSKIRNKEKFLLSILSAQHGTGSPT